jgi:hypothetical protein
MKKLIAVAAIAVSMFSVNANAAFCVPSSVGCVPTPVVGTAGGASALTPVGVALTVGYLVGRNWNEPVPAHLTDACKAQTVKKEGANYSYTTFEGCIK